jgi:hypothetical protein
LHAVYIDRTRAQRCTPVSKCAPCDFKSILHYGCGHLSIADTNSFLPNLVNNRHITLQSYFFMYYVKMLKVKFIFCRKNYILYQTISQFPTKLIQLDLNLMKSNGCLGDVKGRSRTFLEVPPSTRFN